MSAGSPYTSSEEGRRPPALDRGRPSPLRRHRATKGPRLALALAVALTVHMTPTDAMLRGAGKWQVYLHEMTPPAGPSARARLVGRRLPGVSSGPYEAVRPSLKVGCDGGRFVYNS